MKPVQSSDNNNFISLKKAAVVLDIPVEVLLEWNELNILKPTINQLGEIGYTKQQLNRFIELQKSFKNETSARNNSQEEQLVHSNFYQKPAVQKSTIDNINHVQLPNTQTSNKISKSKVSSLKLTSISFLSFLLITGTTLLLSQSNNDMSKNQKNVSDDMIGLISIDKSANDVKISRSSVSTMNVSTTKNDFNKNDDNGLKIIGEDSENNLLAYNKILNQNTSKSLDNTLPSLTNILDVQNIDDGNLFDYQTIDNYVSPIFSSRTNVNDGLHNQNILSTDSESGILALSSNSLIHTILPTSKQYDWMVLLIISFLGLFLVVYHFNSLPTFVPSQNGVHKPVHNCLINEPLLEKLFEVNQQADGTVVVTYKDSQFKISKPELNSETDQLIQRLLDLINEEKEIKYDIIKDEKLNLNTPLSKVVTRLGFVGKKRDLFFPRTSKNKVVFRRYITANDLAIMNLEEQDVIQTITYSN